MLPPSDLLPKILTSLASPSTSLRFYSAEEWESTVDSGILHWRIIVRQPIRRRGTTIAPAVFPGTPFHHDNNIAREFYKLEATFFKGDTKYQALKGMEPYYAAIHSAARRRQPAMEQIRVKTIAESDFDSIVTDAGGSRWVTSVSLATRQKFGSLSQNQDLSSGEPLEGISAQQKKGMESLPPLFYF